MAVPARKYNPGFLTDEEIVASFCVRTMEFELLVEVLHECTGSSNPHQIVIGPRGSGKTSLLLRVAAEVRRNAALASRCFPVVFAEESYGVATAGEFWLECLTHLATQAPRHEDDPNLCRTVDELRAIRDDRALADRCLGALLDFADRHDKRLVLLVENLNMLFRDMADPDAGWRLRKVLQTEPRIIVFASATSRFDEIDHPDRALYDLFRVRTLRPLDTNQCAVLWETVSGRRPARETVRSLEILTGGSPRLISIVARFGDGLSFRELMADLLDLVDDHTEYFKSHLESLPAQERRVYLALAALWKPATTREIADHARLETSTCSAQLSRLGERGVVRPAGGSARRKQYYLTERLYNIYYLLRCRRGPDRLVEALIRFMESFYSATELKDIGARMVHDVGGLGVEMRSLHRVALERLMDLPALAEDRGELLAIMPGSVTEGPGPVELAALEPFQTASAFGVEHREEDTVTACDEEIRRSGESQIAADLERVAKALVKKGVALGEQNRPQDALGAYDKAIRRFGESETPALLTAVAAALVNKGATLDKLNRTQDALNTYDEVIRRFGEGETPALLAPVAVALANKGVALDKQNRPQDALAVYDEVVRRVGERETPALLESVAKALVNKAAALRDLNRPQDALAACDEVIRRFGESETPVLLESLAAALANRGAALGDLHRPKDALAACDEVIRRFGDSETPALLKSVAAVLVSKGKVLYGLNRPEDTLAVCDEVVCRFEDSETPALLKSVANALVNKGVVLGSLNRPQDALAACDEVIRRFGESETPVLLESLAAGLVNKSALLIEVNRLLDALAACDKVVHRFGDSEGPAFLKPVAEALVNKGMVLAALNRPQDALAAYDEVARHVGENNTSALSGLVGEAMLRRANVEMMSRQYEDAAATAGRLLDRRHAGSPEQQVLCHAIRARAIIAGDDPSACEHDVQAVLALLPQLSFASTRSIMALITLSVDLGPRRMRELIKASPSAHLLFPLTTALDRELGQEPRVAQEVDEVAQDIQRRMLELRANRRNDL